MGGRGWERGAGGGAGWAVGDGCKTPGPDVRVLHCRAMTKRKKEGVWLYLKNSTKIKKKMIKASRCYRHFL